MAPSASIGFADQHHFGGAEFGGGGGEHVGEVVLALRVVVGQVRQPALQRGGFGGDDAGVDDADAALFLVGVLLLDDGADAAFGIAHDAAVAGGVREFGDQHREPSRRCQQALQGFGCGSAARRRTAPARWRASGTLGIACSHRVAGAELLRLLRPLQVGLVGEGGLHLVAAMAVDHMDACRIQRARGGDDVRQHRLPGDRLQHLRLGRTHALAFAGGEDDDVQGSGHVRSSDSVS